MTIRSDLEIARSEIEEGIKLTKCQQCGCMSEALDQVAKAIPGLSEELTSDLRDALSTWAGRVKPMRYSCLGCEHCFAAAAQNAFTAAFPDTVNQLGLSCEIQSNTAGWPPLVGEYFALDPSAPVAVTTLASLDLPRQLADLRLPGLAIVGKLETENIGVDKLIKNTLANPNLRFLIVAGAESTGHMSGQTLLALFENGVEGNGRIIGAKGKRSILKGVSQPQIEAFRKQVHVTDLIGCECTDCIGDKIAELRDQARDMPREPVSCGCSDGSCQVSALDANGVTTVFVEETDQPVKLDQAGYFVILPVAERRVINVEHYGYDNRLLHVVEGASARGLYLRLIADGWVTEMSHAAYLGKELAKAEMSLTHSIPYNQDAA